MSLLSAALLDPAELSERQLSGDGGGQRQLVVGTSSSLQFQTWEKQQPCLTLETTFFKSPMFSRTNSFW